MDLKERLNEYRKRQNLTWEQLFDQIEEETGYPCPYSTWCGWLYRKGFPPQAKGVFNKWLDDKEAEGNGSS